MSRDVVTPGVFRVDISSRTTEPKANGVLGNMQTEAGCRGGRYGMRSCRVAVIMTNRMRLQCVLQRKIRMQSQADGSRNCNGLRGLELGGRMRKDLVEL